MTNVEKIIVLDYGSQYNQLITRRIRDLGVFSELLSHRITAEEVKAMNPKGIILSGGPNSVYDENAFGMDPKSQFRYSCIRDLLWYAIDHVQTWRFRRAC